ncbi:MAG: ABC transporter permease [Verrucomicrobiae bacterium]|nr:ABC transporter permease [Verrucomicrobiae bacterium]
MAVPLKYNLRNLRVRWRSTTATVLGMALVVAVFVLVMSLDRGMRATYINTGDPRNLIVLRKGSTAESSSQISRQQARLIRYAPGIARTERDEPLASAEVIVLALLQRREGGQANVQVRGLGSVGLELRPQVRLVEGRMFVPGDANASSAAGLQSDSRAAGWERRFGRARRRGAWWGCLTPSAPRMSRRFGWMRMSAGRCFSGIFLGPCWCGR